MQLIELKDNSKDLKILEEINDEAFPMSEWMSVSSMFDFKKEQNQNIDFLEIYEENKLIGFMFVLLNNKVAYLNSFAIKTEMQNKGYVTLSLKLLKERYKNKQIVLDFEKLDKRADNHLQREKRKQFYLKNGFYETNHYIKLNDNYFEVVCSENKLEIEAFKNLLIILHLNNNDFSLELY